MDKLTGNRRFRIGFGQVLILQVEHTYIEGDTFGHCDRVTAWRDARVEDLTQNMKDLPEAP